MILTYTTIFHTLDSLYLLGGAAGQRVLLPASSTTQPQTIRLTGNQSLAQLKSHLPAGTTILSSSDSAGQMLAFLPNNQQQKVIYYLHGVYSNY